MPVYNGADVIRRSVLSVLGQTDADLELIVVDDRSTDGTLVSLLELQQELSDARFRIAKHSINRGVSAARNTGLALAQGERVAFIDADDQYQPNFVEVMSNAMTPDVDTVVCGREVRAPGRPAYQRASAVEGLYPGLAAAALAMSDRITPFACDKMFRRSLFTEDVAYPSGVARFEDLVTNVVLHSRSRAVRVIRQPLYVYNIQPDSATWGRVPTFAEVEDAMAFVSSRLPASFLEGQGRRCFEMMRSFALLQIGQSVMVSRQSGSLRHQIVRECRRGLTWTSMLHLTGVNQTVLLAALCFKLAPSLHRKLYQRHVKRSFGILDHASGHPGSHEGRNRVHALNEFRTDIRADEAPSKARSSTPEATGHYPERRGISKGAQFASYEALPDQA